MRDDTVLNKMEKELHAAKRNIHDKQKLLTHINHIKLLCELFLEEGKEEPQAQAEESFSEAEIKMMLGDVKADLPERKRSTIDHDGANGDSIFDF